MLHHSIDFKIAAVKFFRNHDFSIRQVASVFDSSKSSLHRWILLDKYNKQLTRKSREYINSKLKQSHLDLALHIIQLHPHITLDKLAQLIKLKFHDFSVTPQWLGTILRHNFITRKRVTKIHVPYTRWGQNFDILQRFKLFYNTVKQYPLNKIICIDETWIGSGMVPEYARCHIGDRCISLSHDNIVFKKHTLIAAISSSKCIGYNLYPHGGITANRLIDFLNSHVLNKHKNHLIILDNAAAHKNKQVIQTIMASGNHVLFCIPYQSRTNAIEGFFGQLKHHIKHFSPGKISDIDFSIKYALKQIEPINYLHHFIRAYDPKYIKHIIKTTLDM
jgi:transposase